MDDANTKKNSKKRKNNFQKKILKNLNHSVPVRFANHLGGVCHLILRVLVVADV